MAGSEHVVQRPVFGNQGVSPPATGVSVTAGILAAFEVDRYSYSPALAGGPYTYGVNGETGLGVVGVADLLLAHAISYSGPNVTIGPGWFWWATVVVAVTYPGTPLLPNPFTMAALKTTAMVTDLGTGIINTYASGYSGSTGQTLPLATVTSILGTPFTVTSITLSIEALAAASVGVAAL